MSSWRQTRVCGALGLLVAVAAAWGAEEAPWQRLLKGDDAEKAKELEHKLAEVESAGKFEEAAKLAEELLGLRERLQGAAHWQTADARRQMEALRRIASLPEAAQQELVAAGKLHAEALALEKKKCYAEAEVPLRKALAIHRKHLGEEHSRTALSLSYLGEDMYFLGRYADAAAFQRQALAIRRKVLGEQHPDTAWSLHYLAGNLGLLNKFTEAEALDREALTIRRAVLGEEHADTADSLNQLALILYDQGKYPAAEPFIKQALAVRRKVLGEENADTAAALSNLAAVLSQQGKAADAAPLNRQALAIRRKLLGEQHEDTAESLSNLAGNLADLNEFTEAEAAQRQALAIYRQVHGNEHSTVATVINNLAWLMVQQGKYADADPLYRDALAIHRKLQGAQHPQVALVLNNLALNLSHQGKHAEAEAVHRQALEIRHKVLGDQHLHTSQSIGNLALSLGDQQRYAEAEPLLRQALAIHRKVLGGRDDGTVRLLNSLAVNLGEQDRNVEAEPLLREALAIITHLYGDEHPQTAQTLNNLATNLGRQGKLADAELLYRRSLESHRKALGENHPYTANILQNLAANLSYQHRQKEEESVWRRCLDIRRKALGERHPDTARTLANLALNLEELGKFTEAETFYRAAVASFEVARLRIGTSGLERAPYMARRSPFANLAGCLARSGQTEEAWRFTESGLARGLLDDLSTRAPLQLEPGEEQRGRARTARLDTLDRLVLPFLTARKLTAADKGRLGALAKEREELQADLAREAGERSRREVVSLDRIQKQIPADAALIFWLDVYSGHWACVVRHSGPPAWVRLPGSGDKDSWTESDDRLPSRLRESLAAGETDWLPLARRLARQRLEPLQPILATTGELPTVSRLIAVPAGRMAGVPLEALTDRFTITYAPSGTVFARLRQEHRPLRQPSLLALGDPAFATPTHTPVPLPEYGLLLTLVLPDGNAAKAGLRGGDVLLSYADQKLTTHADFKPAASGAPVPAQIWREGKTLDVRLSAGKLGVALHRDPAPQALRSQREFDTLLASRTRDTIKPLPGSRYEVKVLRTLFPQAEVLLSSDASEQMLDELAATGRLRDFSVLHLATHGHIDPAIAVRSALLLARDQLPDPLEQARLGRKLYDGRLTVAAIAAGWRLDADLVTLSACETALGPQGNGEGLLGFSQVLLQKGARSLLLSLWKVDDTATALLMTRFYENWLGRREGLKEPMPKAVALRDAQMWLRQLIRAERDRLAADLVNGELRGTEVAARPAARPKDNPSDMPYAHPRYWAAFILLGDPD
jgi:tetratricopeptide (TPR) repeat protein